MPNQIARYGASLAAGNFTPQMYSLQLNAAFYPSSTAMSICNTNWQEDTFKGDSVIIRDVPFVNVFDGVANQDDPVQDITDVAQTLLLNRYKKFCFRVSDIDKFQNDLDTIRVMSIACAKQTQVKIDQDVLQSVVADVSLAHTVGTTIGSATPQDLSALTSATYLDPLFKAMEVLDTDDVPPDERFIVIGPRYARFYMQSDLKAVQITGDAMSPLRDGHLGKFRGADVYMSTNLKNAKTPSSGTPTECLVGHKSAITFAAQFQDVEIFRDPNQSANKMRGGAVYGFKTVKPVGLSLVRVY